MLKIKFIGAVDGVSGSCTWLHHTDSDTQFLVDCGMYQGSDLDIWKNGLPFPFNPQQIKSVLLTHAHIDHCGLLPKLVKEKFCGVVYATRATRDLTMVMLRDSAKVNGNSDEVNIIESINWSILDDDPEFKWGRVKRMADGLRFSALRSSHILGACCFSVSWMVKNDDGSLDEENEKNIFFSGDVGPQSDENPYLPLLKPGHNPFPNTNYIVTEATYGSRTRAAEFQCSKTRRKRLIEIILHTVFNKGGKVILPAFSLHRTQELLADIYWWLSEEWENSTYSTLSEKGKFENPIRVLVDSPLGHLVTEAYRENLFERAPNRKYKYVNSGNEASNLIGFMNELFGQQNGFYDRGNLVKLYRRALTMEGKGRLNRNSKSSEHSDRRFEIYPIIVASAGMCDAGPVVEYLKRFGNDPANTIILTGYQSSGTTGRSLMERATRHCADEGALPEDKAEVIDMSGFYSAHADQDMLLDFLFPLGGYEQNTPAKVFINHGDVASKEGLAEAIRKRAALRLPGERVVRDVCIAGTGWIDLNSDEYLPEVNVTGSACTEELKVAVSEIKSELRELKNMMAKIAGKLEATA